MVDITRNPEPAVTIILTSNPKSNTDFICEKYCRVRVRVRVRVRQTLTSSARSIVGFVSSALPNVVGVRALVRVRVRVRIRDRVRVRVRGRGRSRGRGRGRGTGTGIGIGRGQS